MTTMPLLRDQHVVFMSAERIAWIALEWRRAAAKAIKMGSTFDVIEFLLLVLAKRMKQRKKLSVELIDRLVATKPRAFVTFAESEVVLYIDRTTWSLAKAGHGFSRFVIAHEIGHIILHDGQENGFCNDPSLYIKIAINEYSAEWQANTFAAYFLVPDDIVEWYNDIEAIVEFCEIPDELALDRVATIRDTKRRREPKSYNGEACPNCGEFSLTDTVVYSKCHTCGATIPLLKDGSLAA